MMMTSRVQKSQQPQRSPSADLSGPRRGSPSGGDFASQSAALMPSAQLGVAGQSAALTPSAGGYDKGVQMQAPLRPTQEAGQRKALPKPQQEPVDAYAPIRPAATALNGEKLKTPERQQALDDQATVLCGPEDDRATALYCIDKDSTPGAINLALDGVILPQVARLLSDPVMQQRYRKIPRQQLIAVAAYSTNMAYAMNGVLRGLLKSPHWARAFGPYIKDATKGLEALPQTANNFQGDYSTDDIELFTLDATKGPQETVTYDAAYRNDEWNGMFIPVFARQYAVGSSISEPAFTSATIIKDAYKPNAPIKKKLTKVKQSRSVHDVSTNGKEAEVLFPPGQKFKVTSMQVHDARTGTTRAVANPTAEFPKDNGGPGSFNQNGLTWHIELAHEGVITKAEKAEKANAEKAKAAMAKAPKTKKAAKSEPDSVWKMISDARKKRG